MTKERSLRLTPLTAAPAFTVQTCLKKKPGASELALLYDEISAELRGQRYHIDQLNQRAQQLFSFVAIILALLPVLVEDRPASGSSWR